MVDDESATNQHEEKGGDEEEDSLRLGPWITVRTKTQMGVLLLLKSKRQNQRLALLQRREKAITITIEWMPLLGIVQITQGELDHLPNNI